MSRKIEMAKMDIPFGIIEMADDGSFTFSGPKADFMRRWMQDILTERNLTGEAALQEFRNDFGGGSWWFSEVP
jgi:hypothetical protein